MFKAVQLATFIAGSMAAYNEHFAGTLAMLCFFTYATINSRTTNRETHVIND